MGDKRQSRRFYARGGFQTLPYLLLFLLWGFGGRAFAHASFLRADPIPNSVLSESPPAIQIWFTEALEANYSLLRLYDVEGNLIPAGELSIKDQRISLPLLEPLPKGLYRVEWQALSSSDGHLTGGEFAFAVGEGYDFSRLALATENPVPWGSAMLRWLNLLSFGWGIGGIGFYLFLNLTPTDPRWLWAGWLSLGVTGVLMWALNGRIAPHELLSTRFGQLWVLRMGAWVLMAGAWCLGWRWVAFGAALGILGVQAAFSHAKTLPDPLALWTQFLHLLAMSLWLGGLLCLWREGQSWIPRFSNYARLTTVALLLTGVYLAWWQVGSWEALTSTLYGQALLLKLIFLLPILTLAGLNSLGLSRRFRFFLGLEVACLAALLGTVGVMTATEPARPAHALAQLLPLPYEAQHRQGEQHIKLDISSDAVGANQFTLRLEGFQNPPAPQLEFIFDDRNRSQLRPQLGVDGVYRAVGANLNQAGKWQIRVQVAETAVDFYPTIKPANPDINGVFSKRLQGGLLLYTGVFLVMAGVALGLQARLARETWLLMGFMAIIGGLMVGRAYGMMRPSPLLPASDPAQLVNAVYVRPHEMPMLINLGGDLLIPQADATYQRAEIPAPVTDVYMDTAKNLWAATTTGLFRLEGETWQGVNDLPAFELTETHGFLYALGEGLLWRIPSGKLADVRLLSSPLVAERNQMYVMLGNHSHVLHNGTQVFWTNDLGLSWETLDPPEALHRIGLDAQANLLGAGETNLWRWTWENRAWGSAAPLPEGQKLDDLGVFLNRVYAVAGGNLYQLKGGNWEKIEIVAAGYVVAITTRFPDVLWVLDNRQLFSSMDGKTWQSYVVELDSGGK